MAHPPAGRADVGFGIVGFGAFTPARLAEVLGDVNQAAALFGPAAAAAWLVPPPGAAAAPRTRTPLRPANAGIADVAGDRRRRDCAEHRARRLSRRLPCHHGDACAANPAHQGLLHRATDDPARRATGISASSLTGLTAATVGGIALGALADATAVSTAGAAVLAASRGQLPARATGPEVHPPRFGRDR